MSQHQVRYQRQPAFREDTDEDLDEYLTRQRDWDRARDIRTTVFGSSDKEESCNRAFQAPAPRTPIKPHQLRKLKKGDHIGWHRPYIIWHHAIVVDVDVAKRRVKVIHYGKNSKKQGQVLEQWLYVEDEWGDLYLFNYPEHVVRENPPETVIQRARSKIGQKGYRLLSNNCEHFASFCKTGERKCVQVGWLKGKLMETGDVMVYYSGNVAVAELLEDLLYDKDVFGAAVVVVLEAGFCIYDIRQMYRKKKRGDMTEKDFLVSVTQRVTEAVSGASFTVAGGLVGGAVGSCIPIPVVGTYLGSVIGGGLGSLIGKAVGSAYGHNLGRKLWDL